jgi:hypothetical protein
VRDLHEPARWLGSRYFIPAILKCSPTNPC